MAIHVKSHRRGKSVVKAYLRVGSAMRKADKLLYGNRQLSSGRQQQLRKLTAKLAGKKAQLEAALEGKFRTGAAVLGGVRYKQTKRYFSGSSNSRIGRT